MKGIVLAGGSGTRLHPLTISISKQLLPVYDKPMIYYPISVLMLSGIREILIISTYEDLPLFKNLFGDGSSLGVEFSYEVQKKPNGIAESLIIAENFIENDNFCLILGDNIFHGSGIHNLYKNAIDKLNKSNNAIIFGSYVIDPENYGVAEVDSNNNVLSLEEKPNLPKSNYAVVGLYFYPNSAINIAKKIKPSKRGELEITSVNQVFLKDKKLSLEILGRGFAWLDTGTHDNLVTATEFVKAIETRTGLKIACIEEIALYNKWITKEKLFKSIDGKKGLYYDYLHYLLKNL